MFKNKREVKKTVKDLIKECYIKINKVTGVYELTSQGIEEMEKRGLIDE